LRTRSRIAVSLLALPAGLLLAEGITRVFGLGPVPTPEVSGAVFGPSSEPRLRFENLTDGEQHIVYRDGRGAVVGDVLSRTNRQGFRGLEVSETKPVGAFRIACLGDSHTFGYGVGEGESWPAVLGSALRARPDGARFEVMNCAVNSYEAEQSLAQLELRIERFRPDLVLLGFFVNDTAVYGVPSPPEQERPTWLMKLTDPRSTGFVGWLREHSRLADLVADGIFNRDSLEYFSRSRSDLFREDHVGWIRVRASLARTQARLQPRGCAFVVLLLPFLVEEDGHLGSTRAMGIVREYCEAASIPCIDLEPAFAGRDLGSLRVHPRDFHAGAEAHRILGEAVARELEIGGRL
jgi:hypothetical protein